jgi:hypothetical protein
VVAKPNIRPAHPSDHKCQPFGENQVEVDSRLTCLMILVTMKLQAYQKGLAHDGSSSETGRPVRIMPEWRGSKAVSITSLLPFTS